MILFLTNLALHLLSIILFIFSYIQIDLQCKWYIILSIKKGTFSCLIPYLLYKLLFYINILINLNSILRVSIIFSFSLIGIFSLGFSLIFKDILLTFNNAIIYFGFIIKFNLENLAIKAFLGKILNIVLGIIISSTVFLSFFVIVYLVKKHNEIIFM